MKFLAGIFQFVFGCHHSKLSGVFTIKKRTYQVCLEGGQEFGYSWARMQSVGSSVDNNSYTSPDSPRHAEVPVV